MNWNNCTPQPALGVVRGKRITNVAIARHLGCSADWVSRILLGYVRPPADFRAGLAALLAMDESELFRT